MRPREFYGGIASGGQSWSPKKIGSDLAFYSDGTIVGNQLMDLSGNARHAIITDNLFTDGSFEYGSVMTSWNSAVNGENSTEQAHSGTHSWKIFEAPASGLKGWFSATYRTIAGRTYNYSFWVYKAAGTTFNVDVFFGATGSVTRSALNPTQGEWVNYTGTFTGTGGLAAKFAFYVVNSTITLYIDDIEITEVGSSGVGLIMPNDATLKAIDFNYLMYTSAGVPRTIRTDVDNVAINNRRVFDGGVNKIVILENEPTIQNLYLLHKYFVDNDNIFDTIQNVKTVKTDGSGDYTTVKAANDACGLLSNNLNRFRLDIYDDHLADTLAEYTYTVPEKSFIFLQNHIFLNGIGTGRKIEGTLPENSSDADITASNFMLALYNGGARNLTFNYKNSSGYLMHTDSVSSNNCTQTFYKCNFNHLGADEIVAYRIANTLPAPVMGTTFETFGQGISENQTIKFINCYISGLEPFYIHDRSNTLSGQDQFVNSEIESMPIYHPVKNPDSEIKESLRINGITNTTPVYVKLMKTIRNSSINDESDYPTVIVEEF